MDSNGGVSIKNRIFYKNDTLRYKQSISSNFLSSEENDFPDEENDFPGIIKMGDGRFEYNTFQILDKVGNVIDEMIDYILIQKLEFDYNEFDSRGNWTKRLVKEFGKPYRVETREIKYY